MRLEQQVGLDRGLHLVGPHRGEAGHRVLPDIGIGPAVERALLDMGQDSRARAGRRARRAPARSRRARRCRDGTRARSGCACRTRTWSGRSRSARSAGCVAFTSGSTPILPDEPTPTNSAPVFGSIARCRLAWPLTMPNTPLCGDHLLADDVRRVPLRWSAGTSATRCSTLRPGRRLSSWCGTRQMPSWSATSTSPSRQARP